MPCAADWSTIATYSGGVLIDGFHAFAKTEGLRSKALGVAGKASPPSERIEYEDTLLFGYTAEQLSKLWDSDAGEWAPLLWLASVQRENAAGIP